MVATEIYFIYVGFFSLVGFLFGFEHIRMMGVLIQENQYKRLKK